MATTKKKKKLRVRTGVGFRFCGNTKIFKLNQEGQEEVYDDMFEDLRSLATKYKLLNSLKPHILKRHELTGKAATARDRIEGGNITGPDLKLLASSQLRHLIAAAGTSGFLQIGELCDASNWVMTPEGLVCDLCFTIEVICGDEVFDWTIDAEYVCPDGTVIHITGQGIIQVEIVDGNVDG